MGLAHGPGPWARPMAWPMGSSRTVPAQHPSYKAQGGGKAVLLECVYQVACSTLASETYLQADGLQDIGDNTYVDANGK